MSECGYVTPLWTGHRGWPMHLHPTPAGGHHVKNKVTKFRNRQREAVKGSVVSSRSCLDGLTLGRCLLISQWWMMQQLWRSWTILGPRPAARVFFLLAKGDVDLVEAPYGWLCQSRWCYGCSGRRKAEPTCGMRNKAGLRKGGRVEREVLCYFKCMCLAFEEMVLNMVEL